MNLPVRARVIGWESVDGIGQLETAAGELLKFGRSACTDFEPSVGAQCWLIETKPDPRGSVRAKVVNLTGAAEKDPATAALEKAEREKAAAANAKSEAKAQWLAQSRMPPSVFYAAIEQQTRFQIPEIYQRMFAAGAFTYVDENGNSRSFDDLLQLPALPALLCSYEVHWLMPHEIVSELEPARLNPLPRSALRAQRGVSMNDVRRSWTREVPFVYAGAGQGWYSWNTQWIEQGEAAIVFCEKTGELRGYAPHFEGFLFRQMLEAFMYQLKNWRAREWSAQSCSQFLGRCVHRLEPFLRREWIEVLDHYSRRAPTENVNVNGTPYWSFVSAEEASAEIKSRLAFSHLDAAD